MKPVTVVTGRAVPLDRSDVDTDQIIPSDWLKRVERTGFGAGLFAEWRDDRDFVLNREEYAGATILVAGPNFGIGSSREQAAAVLVHLGVAAVVAPSYSGLYFRNAFNVGLLLLTCAEAETLNEGEQIALHTTAPEIVAPGARRLACEPVPPFLMDMVRAGGLLNQLRQRSGRPAFTKAPDA